MVLFCARAQFILVGGVGVNVDIIVVCVSEMNMKYDTQLWAAATSASISIHFKFEDVWFWCHDQPNASILWFHVGQRYFAQTF